MRLVRYKSEDDNEPVIGVLNAESVIDLPAAAEGTDCDVPTDTTTLLTRTGWRDEIETLVADAPDNARQSAVDVELQAPVGHPGKIICVGLNYVEHIEESDEDPPENPVLFAKFPSSIVGPNDAITWDPQLTEQVDYEVELAAVVGDRARRVDEADAREFVAGYTIANDVSARDLQFADDQWVRGKSLDTFCPLGPALVTADEIGDPHTLDLWTDLNGERLQESNTANLLFDVDRLVSFCSHAFTLEPGDIILTGTPPGVGVFRDPPMLLDDGDEVTVGVEGLGELTNPCRFG